MTGDLQGSASVLVLLAHPRPGSFNHALASRVVDTLHRLSMHVAFHDLYAEGFDPVLRAGEAYTTGQDVDQVLAASDDPLLKQHRHDLSRASALVAIHPNWWGKPPAIMAGWMDRVLVPGVAYRLDDAGGAPSSLLSLRQVVVVNTSDTSAKRETASFGDPLQAIWGRCLPPYLGEPHVERIVLRVVADADAAQREAWLKQVEQRIEHVAAPGHSTPN